MVTGTMSGPPQAVSKDGQLPLPIAITNTTAGLQQQFTIAAEK